ncbi:MAG: diguanylate cyclase domain-containing protein, partial [Mycobacteriales bacterium]
MSGPVVPDPRNVLGGVRPALFRAYVGLVALAGLVVLVAVVPAGDLVRTVPRLGAASFALGGLLLASELRPLLTAGSRDGNGISVSTAFVFAVLLRYDLPLALVLQTLAVLLADGSRRKAPWRIAFNAGQFALAWAAAAAVMEQLGRSTSTDAPQLLRGHDLLAALAGGLVYFVVNQVLVARAVSLKVGGTVWGTLRPQLVYELLTNGALLALAPLVVLAVQAGPGFVPLLVPSLAAVYTVGSIALRTEQQAMSDALTGLANRKRLGERAAQAVAEGPVALVLLDLDRFKEVNDTLGHHVGDQLLGVVAQRLQSSLRPGDTVARLGGDEFALLLPGAGRAEAV